MRNTFVLFDRETESVWYPGQDGALNAVAGKRRGDSIPTAAKAEVLPLEEWLERHPDSKILQPAPISKTVHHLNFEKKNPDKKITLRGRPIVEKEGKTLLWARGNPSDEDAMWFDMTDANIDPTSFDHGLGADRIPSIDEPAFLEEGDPGHQELKGTQPDLKIIGVVAEGEARAYPLQIMNRHELINDRFSDAYLTVAW
jgi:hypothetical protein